LVVRGGGSAANTAAWIAHQGAPVAFVGCVGADPPGEMLAGELDATGVLTCIRRVAGQETGAVVVEVTESGDHVMRSSRGANQALSPSDLEVAVAHRPRYVHLTGYSLLSPFGLGLLAAAGALAASCRAVLSFDPSSEGVVHRIERERLLKAIDAAGVELLLPNRGEANELTGCSNADEAAAALARRVPGVVVKDGARGAVWARDGQMRWVPTGSLRPLDTTGAGDAFNAGFLASLWRGEGELAACERGHACARHVLKQFGGRPPPGPNRVSR
jgi:sugar/nucleoside kinase (ribokinase family)